MSEIGNNAVSHTMPCWRTPTRVGESDSLRRSVRVAASLSHILAAQDMGNKLPPSGFLGRTDGASKHRARSSYDDEAIYLSSSYSNFLPRWGGVSWAWPSELRLRNWDRGRHNNRSSSAIARGGTIFYGS